MHSRTHMHRTHMHRRHIGETRGNMQWEGCKARSYLDREQDRGGFGPARVSVECYRGDFLEYKEQSL